MKRVDGPIFVGELREEMEGRDSEHVAAHEAVEGSEVRQAEGNLPTSLSSKKPACSHCRGYCRFTDEYMLKPVMSSAFMASSTAYLATEVPQFVEETKPLT